MDIRAALMGLAFAFMWSSAFSSARIIVADASPLYALSLRFFLSGLIGLGLAWMLGQTLHFTRAQWRGILIFGICQNALYLGFNFVGMQWVEASLAVIVAATLPLLVAAAQWIFWRDRPSPLGALGLIAGFFGVALIMGSRLSGGVNALGVFYFALGALALTFATLAVKSVTSGENVLMAVGLQMIIGATALLFAALAFETPYFTPTWPLLGAFIYTMIVPGLVATWVWFMLVSRIGATRAATYHFLNPVFGVAVAALLLGERLGPLDLLGVLVVTAGILAVQLSRL